MALPTYSTGTVSVAASGTVVTGVGTIWSGLNVVAGDMLRIGSVLALITDVTDPTHLSIPPWPGATQAGAAYTIYQNASQRFSDVQIALNLQQWDQSFNDVGYFIFVPSTAAAPDPSIGNENQYAFQPSTGKWWLKTGGLWVVAGSPYGASLVADNSFAGKQTITNATDATSSTVGGALTVAGGCAIAKKLYVGGASYFTGTATFAGIVDVNDATEAGMTGGASIDTAGGIYAAKKIIAGTGFATGVIAPQWGSPISVRTPGQCLEWGHTNTGGYGCSLGCGFTNGVGWLAFSASAGTNANTWRTNGFRGSILRGDLDGGFIFSALANSSADNQSDTQTASLNSSGQLAIGSLTGTGSTLTVSTTLIAANKQHQFGANGGSLYDQPKSQGDANILLYNLSSSNWAGIGADASGHVWIKTGTSGTPAAAFVVRADRTIALPAYGAGTLATNSAGIVSASSDERLKEIAGDFTRGLAEVRQLRPILYRWTEKSGLADGVTYAGFGAQAVRKVIPEAIGRDSDGYLSLNDRPIIAALVNAVAELDTKLQKLAA